MTKQYEKSIEIELELVNKERSLAATESDRWKKHKQARIQNWNSFQVRFLNLWFDFFKSQPF